MAKKVIDSLWGSRNPPLHLEALEDRQLLSGVSLFKHAAPAPITESVYREGDTNRDQPITGGNAPMEDSRYPMSGSPPTYRNQQYGPAADDYEAAGYAREGEASAGTIIVVLPQAQPSAGQPQRAQPAAVPAVSRTLTIEPAGEGRTVAAPGPVGPGVEVPPPLPVPPPATAVEVETPWLPPLAAASAECADQAVREHRGMGTEPPMQTLLTGLASLDRAVLQRAVDSFFGQLAHLGEDLTENSLGARLAPWLTAAAVGTAAYAFARHKLQRPLGAGGSAGDGDGRDREWAWFTACAILPPEDKP